MTQQIVNVGSAPNDGIGDPARTAFTKCNANFTELYTADTAFLTTTVAAATYQPLDADLTALAALTGTNTIYYRSAASTWTAITIGTGLTFTSGTLDRAALISGDVTASAGSNVTTIASNAVTYAKMQDVSAASRLIGRGSAAGAGDPQEITLGTNLSMSGTTLNATASGGAGGIVRNATVAFTANGTWTKNANLVGISVEVWGGASGAGQSSTSYGGSGGGYARKWYAAATLGSTVAVTIGAGGAESNSAPGAGGTTTFAASSPVAASGGTYPGPGGSGSGGDINLTGQIGTTGTSTLWGGGGNAPFMSAAGPISANAITAIANTGCGSSTGTGNPGASGYCLVTEHYSV